MSASTAASSRRARGRDLLALYDAVKPQAERYIRMYISMLTGDIRSSVAEHDIIIARSPKAAPTTPSRRSRRTGVTPRTG